MLHPNWTFQNASSLFGPKYCEEGETPQEAYDLASCNVQSKNRLSFCPDAALRRREKDAYQLTELSWLCCPSCRVTVDYFDKDGEKHRIKLKATTQSLSNMKLTI